MLKILLPRNLASLLALWICTMMIQMMPSWRVRNPSAQRLRPALLFCALVLIPVVVQKTILKMTEQPVVQFEPLRNGQDVVHLRQLSADGVPRVITYPAEVEPVDEVGVRVGSVEAVVSSVMVAADEEDEGVPDAVVDAGEGHEDEGAEGRMDGVMVLLRSKRVLVCRQDASQEGKCVALALVIIRAMI